jgi:hypothetical protein
MGNVYPHLAMMGWGRGDGWMDGNCDLMRICFLFYFLMDWQSQQDDRPIPDGGEKEEVGGCRDANST